MNGTTAVSSIADRIIRLKHTNLIERPWGGLRMLEYKGCLPLPDQKIVTGMGIGEVFEIAACDSDAESSAHPSVVIMPDGSELPLPQLMLAAGDRILGHIVNKRFRGEIPLLPKTLDIAELLSVQAHPPGNTEVYVIIDAEPGATIRLGFRNTVDSDSLRRRLLAGRRDQEALLQMLRSDVDHNALQRLLAPAFAERGGNIDDAARAIGPLVANTTDSGKVAQLLRALKAVYWQVLDDMNAIAVRPGQIIYNANPTRVCAANGQPQSAEVHALGNPEGREILMLEIRRPGVTYRAWDNVRFPMRDIDIRKTLAALHLGATQPGEFEREPVALPGHPGIFRSVHDAAYVVDHIRPSPSQPVDVKGRYFHTLHVTQGGALLTDHAGRQTTLAAGQSAIVPATVTAYRVHCSGPTDIVRVSLPDNGTAKSGR